MVVLKPVVWSPNGYKFPAGIDKRGRDYVATSGFGGEEWNGDPGRIWKQQRVFYTNVKGKMEDYAQIGGLGIIMTAYSGNGPCAVGVATSVRFNTDKERTSIAKSFNLVGQARAMWELESIRKRFGNFTDFFPSFGKLMATVRYLGDAPLMSVRSSIIRYLSILLSYSRQLSKAASRQKS